MSATRVSPPPAAATVRVAGDLLLGIVPLTAIGVLLLNDHVLKAVWPGIVTGKLSDIAGLVFFPFLLVGAWQLVGRRFGHREPGGLVAALVAIGATGVVFTLVKTAPVAGDLYRVGLGIVQWPLTALAALFGSMRAAGAPVLLVADPTDLVALPALAIPLGIAIISRASVTADRRHVRDVAIAALSVAMFVGAVVDGWAHNHVASSLETVLTPWHAIIYTSFAFLVAVVLGDAILTARSRPGSSTGQTLTATVRRVGSYVAPGYGPTVVGAGLFLVAGLADTAWHALFGIEADAEALVSPTHLLLGVGAALIASGPAASVWRSRIAPRWPGFLPAALALGTVMGLAGFATQMASPFVDPWAVYPYDAGSSTFWAIAPLGIAAVALQSALIAGGLSTLMRLWPQPPIGALALVVLVGVAPLVFLHDQWRLLAAPIVGAVAAELISAAGWRRGWAAAVRLRVVATITPGAMWIAVVVALGATSGIAWSAHLVAGGFAVALSAGALVGVLTTLPPVPEDA